MSDTPRTDAATNLALTGSWVRAEHARILERELVSANARVKALERNSMVALAAMKSVRQSFGALSHVNATMFDAAIRAIEADIAAQPQATQHGEPK